VPATTAAAATAPSACTCPRCDGRGVLNCFRHVESGRCFMCDGAGTVKAAPAGKPAASVDPNAARKAAWIATATPEQWAKLTWRQIYAARQFAFANPAQPINWPEAAERRFLELLKK
jgi:hypothetical protein